MQAGRLGRDFGGDKLNVAGPQQQKGLPVEIRKPLLHNYSIGCGGPMRTEYTITLDTVSKRAPPFRSVSLLAKTNSDGAILARLGSRLG